MENIELIKPLFIDSRFIRFKITGKSESNGTIGLNVSTESVKEKLNIFGKIKRYIKERQERIYYKKMKKLGAWGKMEIKGTNIAGIL